MSADPKHLTQSTPYTGSERVQMGNGQGLYIKSIGSTTLKSPTQPHTTLALNDLLLVPSITKNLISFSKFAKGNNVYFVFESNCCYVKCQISNRILLQGNVGPDGLYQILSTAVQQFLFK